MITDMQTLAVERALLVAIGPFVLGLVVVGALIFAVWLGIRIRQREPAPPRPEEQPRPPAGGPVREVLEDREPEEVPRGNGRLTSHSLKDHGNSGTRRADHPPRRRRWRPGRSGSFGSGGH